MSTNHNPQPGQLARVRTATLHATSSVAGPTVKALADFVEVARAAGVDERTTVHITHDPTDVVTIFRAVDIDPVETLSARTEGRA